MDPFMMDFADEAAGNVRPLNGLLLGGRGLFGLAALPVVDALKEAEFPMDVVTGTGGGAIVAGLIGLDLPARKIGTLIQDLKSESLIRKTPDRETPVSRLAKLTHGLFGKTEPLIAGEIIPANDRLSDLLSKAFGRRHLDRLEKPIVFEACPEGSRRPLSIERGRIFELAMAALADDSIVNAVTLDGQTFMDASLRRPLAVQAALRLGARRLVGIAPKSAKLTCGTGAKASLDQGQMPDGVLVPVCLPRGMNPWDVSRLDDILDAGKKARDLYLDDILAQDRLAWAA